MGQSGIWDIEARYQKLVAKKAGLENLNELVPWKSFRPILERVHQKPRKSKAGRPAIGVISIFKLLILQQLYAISDEELEYQANDRLLHAVSGTWAGRYSAGYNDDQAVPRAATAASTG